MPDTMSDRMSGRMAEYKSDKMWGKMLDNMRGGMSEDLSDRMWDKLP